MMNVIVVLFWAWFCVSLVIVVRRGIRRRQEKRARREGRQALLHEPTAADTADVEPASTDAFAPGEWVADVVTPAPSPSPAPAVAPAVAPAAAPAAAAAPPPGPRVATIARPAAVTVAQVIAGIEMPCGLVPLTLSDHDLRFDTGQRARFFTTEAPAVVVSAQLTEELERIGLTVSPDGDRRAVAQRGRLAVELRINTVGALIDGVASVEYRSAPPDSVVVEFNVLQLP
jgi:hypothetical protein